MEYWWKLVEYWWNREYMVNLLVYWNNWVGYLLMDLFKTFLGYFNRILG